MWTEFWVWVWSQFRSVTKGQVADFDAIQKQWKEQLEAAEHVSAKLIASLQARIDGYDQEWSKYSIVVAGRFSQLTAEIEECHKHRKEEEAARKKETARADKLERQVQTLALIIKDLEWVRRKREDPEYQRSTEEQDRLLLRRPEGGPDENPPG